MAERPLHGVRRIQFKRMLAPARVDLTNCYTPDWELVNVLHVQGTIQCSDVLVGDGVTVMVRGNNVW